LQCWLLLYDFANKVEYAQHPITEHIKRFGEYFIDTSSISPPLQPDKPFLLEDIQGES
jgi:hypothetical protein